MNQNDKVIQLFAALATKHPLFEKSERVELKRGRSGHWRLFIACLPETFDNVLPGLDELAADCGYTCNPYRKASQVTSVSFADNDEPTRSR